jgi:hypothetical protein
VPAPGTVVVVTWSGARNLWVVATALVAFSGVIALGEYLGRQNRHIEQLNRWVAAT